MTAFAIQFGYLELNYLEDEYLGGGSLGSDGFQANAIINTSDAVGMQATASISDQEQPYGFQANRAQNIYHTVCNGYLEEAYLVDLYLASYNCGAGGWQANQIVESLEPVGFQALGVIDTSDAVGMQAQGIIFTDTPSGMQALQVLGTPLGFQATISLYNSQQLRILCEFPSRGTSGTNWTATNTASGDFSANNLNTDIVEEVWRSSTTGSINVVCDTEIPQGIALDTLAIINHNFTAGAVITLEGADNSGFAPIGFSQTLQVLSKRNNIYYIAPTLPTNLLRYWRINISDNSNPDGYYEMGTVVFGAAAIFTLEECFTDNLGKMDKDFADKVATEGFTNVSNSRALKRVIDLNFQSLNEQLPNIAILDTVFTTFRTTHKCLWIPTPDDTDQEITDRFAVFAKLSVIPMQRYKSVDNLTNYVSLDVNLDESL